MRSKIARFLTVFAGLVGLVSTMAPPASAFTISTVVFAGAATLDGPLGFPGNVTDTLPDTPSLITTLGHCPNGNLPLPLPTLTDPRPQCHFNWGGHTRTVTQIRSDTACFNTVVNINKLGKAPSHTGPCSFGIASPLLEGNHVHGFCGLSGGQVQVRFTDALGQDYTLDLHFNGIGGFLIVEGHWRKLSNTPTQTGLVVAKVLAIPVPTVTPAPTGVGNSCGTSSARVFTLAGTVLLISHPTA